MDELRRSLQAGDPLRHEPALEPADVDAMRRAVLAARPSPRGSHAIMLAIATSLAALVVAGAWIVRSTPAPAASALPTAVGERVISRRQLQFSTPGGTRVIWTFDSDFDRGEDQ